MTRDNFILALSAYLAERGFPEPLASAAHFVLDHPDIETNTWPQDAAQVVVRHPPPAAKSTDLLPEDAAHRADFDQFTLHYGGNPLRAVAAGLTSWAQTTPYPEGSYAKMLAIYANVVSKAAAKLDRVR